MGASCGAPHYKIGWWRDFARPALVYCSVLEIDRHENGSSLPTHPYLQYQFQVQSFKALLVRVQELYDPGETGRALMNVCVVTDVRQEASVRTVRLVARVRRRQSCVPHPTKGPWY